jgi:hypothetical protein
MGFNLKRFLRRTPPAGLCQYFDARRLPINIDWEVPTKAQLEALLQTINSLPQSDSILADFEQIELLCNPIGQRALQSVVSTNPRILSLLQCAQSDEARGITLLLEDAKLFEQAITAAYADGLRYGRSWSAFDLQGATNRDTGLHELKTLEAGIAAALVRADGTVGKLKVDLFQRASATERGEPGRLYTQCTIYSEGLTVSDLVFGGDELARQTRRPVLEVAIWYDPVDRTLDVVAPGGRLVRAKIAGLFATDVLGIVDKISPVTTRRFTLDRLKGPFIPETDTSDGIRSVKVVQLRLAPTSGDGGVAVDVDPNGQREIWTFSEQQFGDGDPLRSPHWHITQAKIHIVFYPDVGRTRDKTVTLELRAPDGSNLREQIRQHQIISQKYLLRWGLVAGPGA